GLPGSARILGQEAARRREVVGRWIFRGLTYANLLVEILGEFLVFAGGHVHEGQCTIPRALVTVLNLPPRTCLPLTPRAVPFPRWKSATLRRVGVTEMQ